MYNFVIPDSVNVRWLNEILLQQMRQHPEWFRSDFAIDTVYGVSACCIWNGNRTAFHEEFCRPEVFVRDVVENYKKWGAGKYCVLFTNFLLYQELLCDAYANRLCREMNRVRCSAMVSTPLMYDYLSSNYPNVELCWSTTTDFGLNEEEQIDTINRLSKNNVVVLPYHLNNRWDLLHQLEHPGNIEVLADEKCLDNCPLRRQHETNANLNNLYRPVYSECLLHFQNYNHRFLVNSKTHNISLAALKRYTDMGINKFKLEGRAGSWELLLHSYIVYFLRENYIDDFSRVVHEQADKILVRRLKREE